MNRLCFICLLLCLAFNASAISKRLDGVYTTIMWGHYGYDNLEIRNDTCYYTFFWNENLQDWPDTLAICNIKEISKGLIELKTFGIGMNDLILNVGQDSLLRDSIRISLDFPNFSLDALNVIIDPWSGSDSSPRFLKYFADRQIFYIPNDANALSLTILSPDTINIPVNNWLMSNAGGYYGRKYDEVVIPLDPKMNDVHISFPMLDNYYFKRYSFDSD